MRKESFRRMSRKAVEYDWTKQRHYRRSTNFPERQLAITKDDEMGDKGGKKDKEKSKKQNASKQEQKTKGKPAQPKSK